MRTLTTIRISETRTTLAHDVRSRPGLLVWAMDHAHRGVYLRNQNTAKWHQDELDKMMRQVMAMGAE